MRAVNFVDYLLIGVILLILGTALWFVLRAKKRGRKCIGCPDSGSCCQNCPGCAGGKTE